LAFNDEMLGPARRKEYLAPTSGWVWGGPALKDGTLYFGDLNGTFYAMDAANGKVVWN
jgi:outer membrane protein assembly factor BamB